MEDSTFKPKLLMRIHDLSASYGKRLVLDNVHLEVNEGDIVLITGNNGCGKSTLLKVLFGLHKPRERSVIDFLTAGKIIGISNATVKDHLAMGLAYVPQKEGLFNDLTVLDNLRISGHMLSQKEMDRAVNHVMSLFPWLKKYLYRKPLSLSGGEYQMVAIAMALLHQPKLLLIDEPIASLANRMAEQVANALKHTHECQNTSMIIVEHRISELAVLNPRRIDLNLGQLSAL